MKINSQSSKIGYKEVDHHAMSVTDGESSMGESPSGKLL